MATTRPEARFTEEGHAVVGERRGWRKRPLVVDAVRWEGDPGVFAEWADRFGSLPFAFLTVEERPQSGEFLSITTQSGAPITVKVGEWVLRGPAGDFYPCDPEIFAETYDEVTLESYVSRDAVSAFFSGEHGEMTAGEFRRRFPAQERVRPEPDVESPYRKLIVTVLDAEIGDDVVVLRRLLSDGIDRIES